MADPEKQETTAAQSDPVPAEKSGGGAAGGDIGLTMSYITSIPGILKIVEFVCIFLPYLLFYLNVSTCLKEIGLFFPARFQSILRSRFVFLN